jgi:membrane dipeptidase
MIVDAKNDLLAELAFRRDQKNPFRTHWLDQLEAGKIRLQVCPFATVNTDVLPEMGLRRGLEGVLAFQRAIRENQDRVFEVSCREDLERVGTDKRLGLMLAMESTEALGYDAEAIDAFWNLGLRMTSLTWNRRTPFADGVAEQSDGGLSNLGRQLIDRMNGMGMIIDLAHASPRTFSQVIERVDQAQIVVSHAACDSVYRSPRNVTDEQLKMLAQRDGVIGIMFGPSLIDPKKPTMERVVDHIDHAVQTIGIKNVGLGSSFREQLNRTVPMGTIPEMNILEAWSIDEHIRGLEGPAGYPALMEALERRQYRGPDLEALLSGNFMRLFKRALPSRDSSTTPKAQA